MPATHPHTATQAAKKPSRVSLLVSVNQQTDGPRGRLDCQLFVCLSRSLFEQTRLSGTNNRRVPQKTEQQRFLPLFLTIASLCCRGYSRTHSSSWQWGFFPRRSTLFLSGPLHVSCICAQNWIVLLIWAVGYVHRWFIHFLLFSISEFLRP